MKKPNTWLDNRPSFLITGPRVGVWLARGGVIGLGFEKHKQGGRRALIDQLARSIQSTDDSAPPLSSLPYDHRCARPCVPSIPLRPYPSPHHCDQQTMASSSAPSSGTSSRRIKCGSCAKEIGSPMPPTLSHSLFHTDQHNPTRQAHAQHERDHQHSGRPRRSVRR